jgi:hypothetical protein
MFSAKLDTKPQKEQNLQVLQRSKPSSQRLGRRQRQRRAEVVGSTTAARKLFFVQHECVDSNTIRTEVMTVKSSP